MPLLLLLSVSLAATAAPPNVDFLNRADDAADSETAVASSDGTLTLSWNTVEPPWQVELQQAPTERFDETLTRYRGNDEGSVLTGLSEGNHFFRIRATDADGRHGSWSPPLQAEVEFMDRGQLFLLLGLGGAVVVLTIGAILSGFLRSRADANLNPAAS